MLQPTKPASMSPAEWRLWCCCHPTVTPPPSSPRPRDNISLEEFDPRNRLSISGAYNNQQPTPHSAPMEQPASTPPPGKVHFTPTTPHKSKQQSASTPKTGEKRQQRPTTMLLPSPPQPPRLFQRPKDAGKIRGGEKPPKMVRQDSEFGEKWWQTGRRMLERKDKGGLSPHAQDEPAAPK